jgi:hypothetical protein
MQRTIQIALLAALVCLCLVNLVVVRFLHARYADDAERLSELAGRVQTMERKLDLDNRWETRTITTEIVTAPADSRTFGRYTLHLDPHTNATQRFALALLKDVGRPVGAWVSEWRPHAEMLKFEEFHVAPNPQTGGVELSATLRTNESVDMVFTITVLEHTFDAR